LSFSSPGFGATVKLQAVSARLLFKHMRMWETHRHHFHGAVCRFFRAGAGSILPTKMFGLLTAFSMIFSLIGDLFMLAPLILIFKPKLPPLSRNSQ
jgi:hypothetical protein